MRTGKNFRDRNKEEVFLPREYRKMLGKNSTFRIKETYNLIRAKLMFTTKGEVCPIYAVTSARENEGKTLNTINLAISFAMAGKKTLIIDGDMRNPSVHRYFRTECSPGLSETLAKIQEKISVVQTEQENLFFMRSGKIPPNPTELISGPVMKKMLEQLAQKFDYIFIDMPPVGVVSDAALLNNLVTGYIMVVRAMHSEAKEVQRAVEILKNFRGNLVGFLLNDLEGKGEKYYGYGKSGYYGYGKYGLYGNEGKYHAYKKKKQERF